MTQHEEIARRLQQIADLIPRATPFSHGSMASGSATEDAIVRRHRALWGRLEDEVKDLQARFPTPSSTAEALVAEVSAHEAEDETTPETCELRLARLKDNLLEITARARLPSDLDKPANHVASTISSMAICLRHFAHGQDDAFKMEAMRLASEESGVALLNGFWAPMKGELGFQQAIDKATPLPALTLGEVAFNAYGATPGPHGPWTTYDGKVMPPWNDTATAPLTRERWEAAARAVNGAVLRDPSHATGPVPA